MRKLSEESYNTISGTKGEWIGTFPPNSHTKTMWSCWKCGFIFPNVL
jgi:hypothetical protein